MKTITTRYWFIAYWEDDDNEDSKGYPVNNVIDVHPVEWELDHKHFPIIFYRETTKEMYTKWKKKL